MKDFIKRILLWEQESIRIERCSKTKPEMSQGRDEWTKPLNTEIAVERRREGGGEAGGGRGFLKLNKLPPIFC